MSIPEKPFFIRQATRADWPEMVAVWEKSVIATHHFLTVKDRMALKQEMPEKFLPALEELWLCIHEDKIAAFAGWDDGMLEMLFVHPDYFRRGIGRRLIKHLQSLHGKMRVDVNEQNEAAFAFYKKCGFILAGRSETDASGRPYPLLHLVQK